MYTTLESPLFLFLLITQLFFSCTVTKPAEQLVTERTPVNFTVLKKGILYGGGSEEIEEGVAVVRSFEELQSILAKVNSANQTVDEGLVSDIHFFDENMLIFVFDKLRGTGGFTMSVQGIYQSKEHLVLELVKSAPDGPATTVMTQPFQIIELQKSDLPVSLKTI